MIPVQISTLLCGPPGLPAPAPPLIMRFPSSPNSPKPRTFAPRTGPIAGVIALLLASLLGACGEGGGGGAPSNPSLLAPGGSAAIGGDFTIRWSVGSNPATVRIELSSDDGASFPTLIVASTPDDGSFTFDTTAYTDGANFRLRLTPINGFGDGQTPYGNTQSFSIDNTLPVTTLVDPDGGDLLGGSASVTWSTTDANPGDVLLELSADGGSSFPTVLAASAPDDGSFTWNTSALADGSNYRIRVTSTDLAGNVGATDFSAADFELDNTAPSVNLFGPLGGENLTGTTNITWSTTDANPSTVTLELSTNSGVSFSITLASGISDVGSYAWNTASLVDSSTIRIRVLAVDGAGNVSSPAESGDVTVSNLVLIGPAVLLDVNSDGVLGVGDQIYLRFNKNVVLNSTAGGSVQALGNTSSFGAGASIATTSLADVLLMTLGTSPSLKGRGDFDPAQASSVFISGIDISSGMVADAIETADGMDAAPNGGVDLAPGFVLGFSATASLDGTSVALGDLDGDGDLDALVGETNGRGGSVRLNDGTGDFSSLTAIGTYDTLSVALADLDRDGDLDAVLGVDGAGNRILFNDGSGVLTDSGQSLGSAVTQRVVVGDFDRDGDPDLAFANGGTAGDRIFINDGAGVFTDSGQSLGSSNTQVIGAADFDEDGDLDLIAGYALDGPSNQIWLNNGNGVFTAGNTVLLTTTRSLDIADLDGDGDLDVFFSINGQNQVALGDGFGAFIDSGEFFGNNDHRDVKLADLDGDGDYDAATPKYADGDRQWINNGSAVFTEFSRVLGVQTSTALALGDLNGDGDLDFYSPGETANHDRAWGMSLSGAYGPTVPTDGGATLGGTAASHADTRVGDFDSDGDLDVFVGSLSATNSLWVNNGSGTFSAGPALGSTESTRHLFVDVDRDGDLDLVEGLSTSDPSGGGVRIWTRNSVGAYVDSGVAFGGAVQVTALASGDINADGYADVVMGTASGAPQVYLGGSGGGFTQTGQALTSGASTALELGDFNRDGFLDIVQAQTAGDLVIHFGVGDGTFTSPGTTVSAGLPVALRLADINSDGDLDILTVGSAGGTDGQERVFSNDGSGGFTQTAIFDAGVLSTIELVDWNADGNVDALFGGSAGLAVYLGNGAGTFSDSGDTTVAEVVSGLAVGDLDRDGAVDVFTAVDLATDRVWFSR